LVIFYIFLKKFKKKCKKWRNLLDIFAGGGGQNVIIEQKLESGLFYKQQI